ncbi:MAG: hypothetical protein WBC90_09395 [Albidovulum sp.]
MRHEHFPALATFLVEDVILTLGNMRGSLAWLGQADTKATPDLQRAGLARLDRQIATLEERAWAVCQEMRDAQVSVMGIANAADVAPPVPGPEPGPEVMPQIGPATPSAPAPLPRPEHPSISLESLLRDALSGDAPLGLYEGPPTFRSCRRARR